jgi:hypothetical protein
VQDEQPTEAERSYEIAPYDIEKVRDLLIRFIHQRTDYGYRRVSAAVQFRTEQVDEAKGLVAHQGSNLGPDD